MTFTEDMLRGSQLYVADFIIDNPFCACFSNMGFGKTAAVTTPVEKLFRLKEIEKLLVVTTLKVAENTWPDEIQEWQHTSYLKFSVITGDADKRLAAVRGSEQIHIINQENFVWLAERAGRKWPYDMVVFDDAEGFKNAERKTKPKKTICAHAENCPLFMHEKSGICRESDFCAGYHKSIDDDS